MSARTIISLVVGLIKFANLIFGWLHDNALIKEGEDRQVAKALAEMAKRSTTIKEVEGIYAKMTPEEITRALEGSGDFRD